MCRWHWQCFERPATLCRGQRETDLMDQTPVRQNDQKTIIVVDDDPWKLLCALYENDETKKLVVLK
jgi:hypothetical protein